MLPTVSTTASNGSPSFNGATTPVSNYNTVDYTAMSQPTTVINSLKKNKYKLFASEFAGMAVFILMSLSNVAIFSLMDSNMSWEGVAISWGFNLLFGIKIASYGNAYLNPCIAFCDYALSKSIDTCEFFIYLTAELTGAFAGAAITYGLHRNLYLKSQENNGNDSICGYFATYNTQGVNMLQAFFVEFIGTALFSMSIFKILKTNGKHAPYAISMSLAAITLALGFQTAFSYNWARDFGPRLFITIVETDCFSLKDNYWFIPLLANFAGGAAGWLIQ